jgi:hypothetical protein
VQWCILTIIEKHRKSPHPLRVACNCLSPRQGRFTNTSGPSGTPSKHLGIEDEAMTFSNGILLSPPLGKNRQWFPSIGIGDKLRVLASSCCCQIWLSNQLCGQLYTRSILGDMISRVLFHEGANACISVKFYKAAVLTILLHGSESWVWTRCMHKAAESFHNNVARPLSRRTPRLWTVDLPTC